MEEDLYKKYLRNIKNGRTAIKKEYVDRGYFSYYSKREIYNHLNSKRIIIDGVNGEFDVFVDNIVCNKVSKNKTSNKRIYLGKINKRLLNKYINLGLHNDDFYDYNISIGEFEIRHALKHHSSNNEYKRGQIPLTSKDFKQIPNLLLNSTMLIYLGKNVENKRVYKFVSNTNNGRYVLLEFASKSKHQLGFQSLYIIQNKKRFVS